VIRQTLPKALSIHSTYRRGDPGLKSWATSRALSKQLHLYSIVAGRAVCGAWADHLTTYFALATPLGLWVVDNAIARKRTEEPSTTGAA
jgi:hypothetical protein